MIMKGQAHGKGRSAREKVKKRSKSGRGEAGLGALGVSVSIATHAVEVTLISMLVQAIIIDEA
jgi:hypothetical protein